MVTEGGGMSWMSPNMKMETNFEWRNRKIFGSSVFRRKMFQNVYTAQGGEGMIAFASCRSRDPSMAFEIAPGQEMILQKKVLILPVRMELSYLHSLIKRSELDYLAEKVLLCRKHLAIGIMFAEFDGHVVEYELEAGEQIVVDTGHLAAMTASCTMEIKVFRV